VTLRNGSLQEGKLHFGTDATQSGSTGPH